MLTMFCNLYTANVIAEADSDIRYMPTVQRLTVFENWTTFLVEIIQHFEKLMISSLIKNNNFLYNYLHWLTDLKCLPICDTLSMSFHISQPLMVQILIDTYIYIWMSLFLVFYQVLSIFASFMSILPKMVTHIHVQMFQKRCAVDIAYRLVKMVTLIICHRLHYHNIKS